MQALVDGTSISWHGPASNSLEPEATRSPVLQALVASSQTFGGFSEAADD
jgi:hypothetical protein